MTIGVGKKVGMTQVEADGKFVAVSVLEIIPLIVSQVKKENSDGYNAVQVGVLDSKRKSKLKKPQIGHLKKIKDKPYSMREFRILDKDTDADYKRGQKLGLEGFEPGDRVTIVGVSKGRGFQGMIKRHKAHRGPETHGSNHHRAPGSIGQCSFPARVFKGKKMPGRAGVKRATIKNLRIIKMIADKNLILVKGSVPGKKNSYLGIKLIEKAKVEKKA